MIEVCVMQQNSSQPVTLFHIQPEDLFPREDLHEFVLYHITVEAFLDYLQPRLQKRIERVEWRGQAVESSTLLPVHVDGSPTTTVVSVWISDKKQHELVGLWHATVYDLLDNCGAVFTNTYASQEDAARNLFVWLIQNRYLPEHPDSSIVADQDVEEGMMERFRQCVEEGTAVMSEDVTTSDELFSWCRLLSNGSFVRQWTFTIEQIE